MKCLSVVVDSVGVGVVVVVMVVVTVVVDVDVLGDVATFSVLFVMESDDRGLELGCRSLLMLFRQKHLLLYSNDRVTVRTRRAHAIPTN